MANPLNAYNLIRHIAVGWLMVENALEEEKKHRQEVGAQLPKRVKKILARRKKEYIPDTKDLEGAATAIVRLHDFYRLTSFFALVTIFTPSFMKKPEFLCFATEFSETNSISHHIFNTCCTLYICLLDT